jgi:hypothetical protein
VHAPVILLLLARRARSALRPQDSPARSQIGKGGDQLMPVFMTREEIDEYGEDVDSERGRILKNKYLP